MVTAMRCATSPSRVEATMTIARNGMSRVQKAPVILVPLRILLGEKTMAPSTSSQLPR